VDEHRRGLAYGCAAAVSFGVSTPLAKRLLDDVSPQLLAGLLYLGAFLALAVLFPRRRRTHEAPLRRADMPRVVVLVAAGGVAAPVLLLVGLDRVAGSTGSLLLNLEGPFTLLVAVVVFREHLGRRPALGAAAIFAGAVMLSWSGPATSHDVLGAACIAAACALWAVDNNLTQALTVRDPVAIVRVKAAAGAVVNVALAVALGATWPVATIVVAALVLGAVSYGLSVLLDAYALRALGAAREAAIFATAPFVGAIVAVPLLSEHLGVLEIVAGGVMAGGASLMLTERHVHLHTHQPIVHEHAHRHDAHHRHEHEPGVAVREPHTHVHEHDEVTHAHPHVSDVHHRHEH
jgi:drug/metabolite transporter (DMT)-like permease